MLNRRNHLKTLAAAAALVSGSLTLSIAHRIALVALKSVENYKSVEKGN